MPIKPWSHYPIEDNRLVLPHGPHGTFISQLRSERDLTSQQRVASEGGPPAHRAAPADMTCGRPRVTPPGQQEGQGHPELDKDTRTYSPEPGSTISTHLGAVLTALETPQCLPS